LKHPVSTPFGTLLGYAPGQVAAYSSDYATASDEEYPKRSSYRSYVDGIYMGYKWQCVEFARRWMYVNHGYIFDDIAMAYDIFELRSVRHLASNTRLPLHAYRNGSLAHPQRGSLLIWREGGEFEDTGHVAVITAVTGSYIRIAEQNVGHASWEGRDYARELKARVSDDGEYWVTCSYGDAEILGWMTQTEEAIHAEPVEELDIRLHRIKTQHAIIATDLRKSWLNIANDDEAAFVDVMGGHFLTSRPEEQSRYFTISETAKDDIERATNELHGLFMHATDYVLQNEELLAKFNLPAVIIPKIRQSWDNRLNEIITSRFDFALTQDGLKVYEYNCDSASCFMEAGKVQGKWAKAYGVKDGDDAGQDLFNDLVDAWKKSQAKGLVHIMRDEDLEEVYHANFMREAILAAGLDCCIVVGNQGLVWGGDGNIFDEQGQQVKWVWKTWAWETALDQIREECNVNGDEEAPYEPQSSPGSIPRLSDVLFQKNVMVFEPLWSLIPSNKAILPVLWALFPNHHNLLNSSFELNEELLESGYVTKPIVGRCGSNISLRDHQDTFLESTGGNFEDQETIFQQLFALPRIEDYYVQICAFTAAGIYAGSCVRVDTSMIINQESDCLPLRVNEDAVFLSKT